MSDLGAELARLRGDRGWSLREVERRTGIHNAHLSQVEKGQIERPDPALLWTLSTIYDVDFHALMKLAGHLEEASDAPRRSLVNAAMRALDLLPPDQQAEALEFMRQLERRHRPEGPDT